MLCGEVSSNSGMMEVYVLPEREESGEAVVSSKTDSGPAEASLEFPDNCFKCRTEPKSQMELCFFLPAGLVLLGASMPRGELCEMD